MKTIEEHFNDPFTKNSDPDNVLFTQISDEVRTDTILEQLPLLDKPSNEVEGQLRLFMTRRIKIAAADSSQVLLIGINPSIAQSFDGDPTTRKILQWADSGIFDALPGTFSQLTLINLVSLISPKVSSVPTLIKKYGGKEFHCELAQRILHQLVNKYEGTTHIGQIWGFTNSDSKGTGWKEDFVNVMESKINELKNGSKIGDVFTLIPDYPLHTQVIQGKPRLNSLNR